MALDREDVEHIAILARIGLTEEEVEMFREQLSNILDQFETLKEVDTAGVAATLHAGQLHTVLREDVVEDSLEQEQVLSNAPRREGPLFRVKAVLEE
ncbi:MAG: asparaginyl/glutamyl-tRNA amidotransferase subunit C [SAR202 cluster bacterium Io17-Chloro-G7]|nr:MAG: asparaginyl/glutamyl-tRNA amidotransferase subunit C [SAR202 cluster bacterium Io17-Chloro-G7]